MLKSGITLNESLRVLGEQSDSKKFAQVIFQVQDDIEQGTSLSAGMEKHRRFFGSVFVSLIRAGEKSGSLGENLDFLSSWFERNADLQREVSSAMLYPKIVFGATILLGGGLSVFILPRLVPLFGQLNVELPLITKILLAVSLFVEEYWHLVIVGAVAFVFLLVLINRILFIQRLFHSLYIGMPFLGRFLRNYQLALVTQLFGTLLRSGLTLRESVSIVEEAATNLHYKESLHAVEKGVVEGTTLSESLTHFPALYPKMFINIVGIGEQSGTLSDSFVYLSEYYSKEVTVGAKKMPTIIEPLLLIFIALAVGFVALAIIMPIYKLTGSITG